MRKLQEGGFIPYWFSSSSIQAPSLYQSYQAPPNPLQQQVTDITNGINQQVQGIRNKFHFNAALSDPNSTTMDLYMQDVGQQRKQAIDNAVKTDVDEVPEKQSFIEKYSNSWIGQNAAGLNKVMDTASTILGQQPKGELQAGIDSGWNSMSDAVSSLGPYGQMAGTAMKAVNLASKLQSAITGGTSGMTKVDQILDSPVGTLIPGLGLINQLAGKKADTITKDEEVFADSGDSYTATDATVDAATEKSGKKYGLFSSGARKKANEEIAEAKRQQSILTSVVNNNNMQNNLVGSMSATANANYTNKLSGGYNQGAIHAGRQGMSFNTIQRAKQIVSCAKFKNGGKTKKQELRSVDKLIEEAKRQNPRFIQRLSEDPRGIEFMDKEGNKARGNVYLGWGTGLIDDKKQDIIYPQIQEMEDGSLHFFEDPREAYDNAINNHNVVILNPGEASKFFEDDPEYGQAYKRYWPKMFKETNWIDDDSIIENLVDKKAFGGSIIYEVPIEHIPEEYREGGVFSTIITELTEVPEEYLLEEFKKGGKVNVIPQGALHARLHHMDNADDLTKKGIPVVSEGNDGKREQQAEIEHSEIIFRLDVTKKLEDYLKQYNDTDSKKEKDSIAIEAGKLLVDEILNNTIDNTKNIL